MNKLFKSVGSSAGNKDSLIKESIISQLSNSVKEIQYSGIEEGLVMKADFITEATSAFCMTIEAIFLHGLKDSLSNRFKRAIADMDERPEPSFWAPLLVISHKQIIKQIIQLTRITTEVGQCRAWIRLAFNESLLSSYLETMRRDSSALKSFYRPSAFVRDSELLDVAQRLIEGIEAFKTFTLPCNSSLLNTWQLPSLYLAGIWAPTLKACPVAPCDDVAQIMVEDSRSTIVEPGSDTCSLSSAMSIASQGSGLRQVVAMNEDEALMIILANKASDEGADAAAGVAFESSDSEGAVMVHKTTKLEVKEPQEVESVQVLKEEISSKSEINEVVANEPKEASFNKLLESYNMFRGPYIKTPDLREVLQKFEENNVTNVITPNNNVRQTVGFAEIVKSEPTSLSAQVGIIAREKGLDLQNFQCAGCNEELGITIKPILKCGFTGEYFCNACMSLEAIPIPAKIIHNWDFKHYSVSKKAYDYINEIKDHPVINFKVLNTFIYSVVDEMAHLQILRTQLNLLRAYLYTCREPIIEQLQKQMWPKEYMYEHLHQYSISDLSNVMNGHLAHHLQSVVNFGKEHVFGCCLCSQKGFVCEVCNKPKALFPFDVENIYRCEECNAVYHKNCLNSSKPCPKCKRRRERDQSLLMGAIE